MIETNAERLKQADDFLKDLVQMGDGVGLHGESIEVVNWLIEQSEKLVEIKYLVNDEHIAKSETVDKISKIVNA